ncbi:preprotein translocase subunit SecB [Carboxydocella sporoproducens DSM 16521]|uniref:Preprotein translocase subunit SecB n=2 Tax=Carboxydocella TaxID=178898 RepID=A0A1T4MHM1_9FIRM|nr:MULTISPECIES: hypothetical protein [Carboxydocella]AVX21332.1 preprotein translocase subunit SecB [Carboxydocella thermautotrophica]SJZ66367.1 preprotein translocase subunit SecB [Carboxydocella sporoproducens DSM 16521]
MDEKLYNTFISLINLNSIELDLLHVIKNENFNKQEQLLNIGIKFEILEINHNGYELNVPFNMTVIAYSGNNEGEGIDENIKDEDKCFTISLQFTLSYNFLVNDENKKLINEFTEEVFSEFANRNVIINAWPYARELVSNLTTRMGFAPLFIPPYKNLPVF